MKRSSEEFTTELFSEHIEVNVVLLTTALISMRDSIAMLRKFRALMDSNSEASFVSEDICSSFK